MNPPGGDAPISMGVVRLYGACGLSSSGVWRGIRGRINAAWGNGTGRLFDRADRYYGAGLAARSPGLPKPPQRYRR